MKKIKLFFALFAMLALGVGNAWGAEYELVTSEPSDWSGEYLVVYNKGCFNGSLTTGFDKSAPVDVTISNNKINLDEKYAMIIGKQGTAYSLKTASGYYIGREDQSVNETVMIGRIDQQIRVNKIMMDYMVLIISIVFYRMIIMGGQ